MSPDTRRALIEQMGQEYMRRLEAKLPDGPLTLDQIEAVVEDVAREQNAVLEEQAPPPCNQAPCPKCGALPRFKTRTRRHIPTIHSSRRFSRRYHQCRWAPRYPHRRPVVFAKQTRSPRLWSPELHQARALVGVPRSELPAPTPSGRYGPALPPQGKTVVLFCDGHTALVGPEINNEATYWNPR